MAQTMGCSKGTIMSRLFHARRNMQKRLSDLVDPSALAVATATDPDDAEADADGDGELAARSR